MRPIILIFLFCISCTDINKYQETNADLKKLMNEHLSLDNNIQPLRANTLNSPFAAGSSGSPKSTTIVDYMAGGYLGLLHVKLDQSFEHNLPEEIKEQLKRYNLYQNNKADIYFIVQ